MIDRFNREIDYLRVSVTDRCNLRCTYCVPKEGICFMENKELLTDLEILEICKTAAACGIRKIKITGGEPLVRKGIAKLIGAIADLDGIEEVTMTTNGIFLEAMLPELIENHLSAVNISLDTLDRDIYKEITGFDALPLVLKAMEACVKAGLKTKVNAILGEQLFDKDEEAAMSRKRLFENGSQLLKIAQLYPVDVRFIEMMPIGLGRDYKTIAGTDFLDYLKRYYPDIKTDKRKHGNGPAVYYTIPGFKGSLGFISAMHGKFCSSCNRVRMTCTGEIKPCLCYSTGFDLRAILRKEGLTASEKEKRLLQMMKKAIGSKPEAHCFENPEEISESKKMVMIGG